MKISGPVPSQVAASVWAYATRTLTRNDYFRKTHIEPTVGSTSVPAASATTQIIQPPAGETWEITLGASLGADTAGSYVEIELYDGTSFIRVARMDGGVPIACQFTAHITNAKYLRIRGYNAHATLARTLAWGYSGWTIATS